MGVQAVPVQAVQAVQGVAPTVPMPQLQPPPQISQTQFPPMPLPGSMAAVAPASAAMAPAMGLPRAHGEPMSSLQQELLGRIGRLWSAN